MFRARMCSSYAMAVEDVALSTTQSPNMFVSAKTGLTLDGLPAGDEHDTVLLLPSGFGRSATRSLGYSVAEHVRLGEVKAPHRLATGRERTKARGHGAP